MRAIVNVSTGGYIGGQRRLTEWCSRQKPEVEYFIWNDKSGLPPSSPSHADVPYAFKAYALQVAQFAGAKTLLWCDASIIPVKPITGLFELIEEKGYWIGNNGWTNYEWTADEAYPHLFAKVHQGCFLPYGGHCLAYDRAQNRLIKHVVAGSFGISLDHPKGKRIMEEYFRLASETKAFCGPWVNTNYTGQNVTGDARNAPCGPSDVRGHRHDQTALSVIAWQEGCELTNSPNILSYRGGETADTYLVMDGKF
jgi:hypothetical protein